MALYLGSDKIASGYYGNSKGIIDEYSQAEIKTNKVWVDGKPIYRKVIVSTTPSDSNWTNIALGTSDIDKITNKDISFELNGRVFDGSYYESTDYYSYYSIDTANNNLQIRVCSLFYNKELRIVLEYTKTTDNIASGMIVEQLPRKLDNYSNEEQIVGTWFGKPLYRKVVDYTLATPSGYPSYPNFDTGIRDIEFAMIDAYFTNGDNLQYFRVPTSWSGYLTTGGIYNFILLNSTQSAEAGLYTFVIHYTKTTDQEVKYGK